MHLGEGTMEERLLPAVQKAYDVTKWLIPLVEKFPRSYKFTLGDRIQTTALDLCLALVEGAHARAKERPLHRADRLLDQLRLLARLSWDLRLISARQYEYLTGLIEELGRMIGGWLRFARTPSSPDAVAGEGIEA